MRQDDRRLRIHQSISNTPQGGNSRPHKQRRTDMKAIIRIFKKLAAPIIFMIDTLRILAYESENGGIDGEVKR